MIIAVISAYKHFDRRLTKEELRGMNEIVAIQGGVLWEWVELFFERLSIPHQVNLADGDKRVFEIIEGEPAIFITKVSPHNPEDVVRHAVFCPAIPSEAEFAPGMVVGVVTFRGYPIVLDV